jgi:hypothetical protein
MYLQGLHNASYPIVPAILSQYSQLCLDCGPYSTLSKSQIF